jgi:tetratricopeptide (TPR) repeat protein
MIEYLYCQVKKMSYEEHFNDLMTEMKYLDQIYLHLPQNTDGTHIRSYLDMYSGVMLSNDRNFPENFRDMSDTQKYKVEMVIRGLMMNLNLDLGAMRNSYHLAQVNDIERRGLPIHERLMELSKLEDRNNVYAIEMIAYHLLQNKLDIEGDIPDALDYIQKLLDKKLDSGVYLLGMYQYSMGDYKGAFKTFESISERYKDAMAMMAIMYHDGDYVSQDITRAVELAHRAHNMPQVRPITNNNGLIEIMLQQSRFLEP